MENFEVRIVGTGAYLRGVLPVHGVDGRGRRHPRVHVHQLRVGWIPRGPIFHPADGMVGHVRGARMVWARRCSPARNFGCCVGHEVRVKEAVGLLGLRRRLLTTLEGVRIFHFAAGAHSFVQINPVFTLVIRIVFV